jgi:hypothetical protein
MQIHPQAGFAPLFTKNHLAFGGAHALNWTAKLSAALASLKGARVAAPGPRPRP